MIDKENSRADKNDNYKPILDPQNSSTETTSNSMPNSNISEDKQPESQHALVKRIKVSDRWMIHLTAALVFASILSAIIFYKQWQTMHGQLDQMISTGKQTDELIKANVGLAESAKKQAAAATEAAKISRDTFNAAKDAANAANISAIAANEANRLSREMFEASQRPWVKLAGITIKYGDTSPIS